MAGCEHLTDRKIFLSVFILLHAASEEMKCKVVQRARSESGRMESASQSRTMVPSRSPISPRSLYQGKRRSARSFGDIDRSEYRPPTHASVPLGEGNGSHHQPHEDSVVFIDAPFSPDASAPIELAADENVEMGDINCNAGDGAGETYLGGEHGEALGEDAALGEDFYQLDG